MTSAIDTAKGMSYILSSSGSRFRAFVLYSICLRNLLFLIDPCSQFITFARRCDDVKHFKRKTVTSFDIVLTIGISWEEVIGTAISFMTLLARLFTFYLPLLSMAFHKYALDKSRDWWITP